MGHAGSYGRATVFVYISTSSPSHIAPSSFPPSQNPPLTPLPTNRLEAARHCRWVDEVVSDAPWVISPSFLAKYEIDYVAHDEDPYAAAGHEDVYALVKGQGACFSSSFPPYVSPRPRPPAPGPAPEKRVFNNAETDTD